jgi:hypothetical protein
MKRAALALVLGLACIAGPADARLQGGGSGFFGGDAKPQAMYRMSLNLDTTKTVITVTGDGKGDMDCYLYEGRFPNATFVTRDDSSRDGCRLEVTAKKAGLYQLLVQNTSDKTEHYTVVVD